MIRHLGLITCIKMHTCHFINLKMPKIVQNSVKCMILCIEKLIILLFHLLIGERDSNLLKKVFILFSLLLPSSLGGETTKLTLAVHSSYPKGIIEYIILITQTCSSNAIYIVFEGSKPNFTQNVKKPNTYQSFRMQLCPKFLTLFQIIANLEPQTNTMFYCRFLCKVS